MKKSDFYFDLPPELIAQTPIPERDHSRLLCMDKVTGELTHRHFYDLPSLLREGDCLVVNDSRVLPARLIGHRPSGGAAELVLLRELGDDCWECLCRPGKRLREGAQVSPGKRLREGAQVNFGDGELTATVEEVLPGGNRRVRFHYEGIFLEVLDRLGKMPLPPYIKEELSDRERYQTVYSRELGSAAAPTAGLHFTPELMEQIRGMGIPICPVTLHVGLGTFRPVKEDEIEDHEMHSEFCIIPEETAAVVNRCRQNGGRVIAVGTTSCRTLESFADEDGMLHAVDDAPLDLVSAHAIYAETAILDYFHKTLFRICLNGIMDLYVILARCIHDRIHRTAEKIHVVIPERSLQSGDSLGILEFQHIIHSLTNKSAI